MVLGGGTVLNCSRKGIVRTWGSSGLQTGFVRTGTGWGMELSLQRQSMYNLSQLNYYPFCFANKFVNSENISIKFHESSK